MNLSSSKEFVFANLISSNLIAHFCSDCRRFRVFDPSGTLYCFLYQVMHSCSAKHTLLNFNTMRMKNGLKQVSMNTAAYVKSRKRLCMEKLKYLACQLGLEIDETARKWEFKDRSVLLGDGTVIRLEDTKDIKTMFPVPDRLGRQHGSPKMRFFAIFSASSGAFLDGEVGAYLGKGEGETSLLKKLLARLEAKSILVLDKYFTSLELRLTIINSELDYVIRARERKSEKLLKKFRDKEIKETFVKDGKKIEVNSRYIKSSIKRRGFRESKIFIVTSLTRDKGFSFEDIVTLYLKRWGVEINIRHLKESLKCTQLKLKTGSGVIRELWVHLIAYNLIRKLGNANSLVNNKEPTKQAFRIYIEILRRGIVGCNERTLQSMLNLVRGEILNSKYRREPRAIKWKHRKYEEMKVSREEARKQDWGKSGRKHRRLQRQLMAQVNLLS